VQVATERSLAARGFYPATSAEQPDFIVSTKEFTTAEAPLTQQGAFWLWQSDFGAMSTAMPPAYGYRQSTVVMDFTDARTGELVWSGKANGMTTEGSMDKLTAQATGKILQRYPVPPQYAGAPRPPGG
jgi:hypothetical protein